MYLVARFFRGVGFIQENGAIQGFPHRVFRGVFVFRRGERDPLRAFVFRLFWTPDRSTGRTDSNTKDTKLAPHAPSFFVLWFRVGESVRAKRTGRHSLIFITCT